MLWLCSQPLLLALTGCKFARWQRWATLCDIITINTYMLAVRVSLDGEKGGLMLPIFIPQKNSLCKDATLTPAVCRSFCSRWLLRSPPQQPEWGNQRCSSTSCVRTRSQILRPAWGTAARPLDTSRRMQPGSRSGEHQRLWSTPAERKTHADIVHTSVRKEFDFCLVTKNNFLLLLTQTDLYFCI